MPYAYEKNVRVGRKKKTNLEKKILKYELTHVDRIILAIMGIVGLAFFFRGLYILMENINVDPGVSIILGVALMFCSGYLIKGGKIWKTR
jgi:hypothetical protein